MRLEQSTLWAIALVVAIIAALAFKNKIFNRQSGFKDWVKNPRLFEKAYPDENELKQAIDQAQQWSDTEIAKAVKSHVFDVKTGRDAWLGKRVLNSLGNRTHPPIIKILGDAALRKKLMTPAGGTLLPEAPFNRACDLLSNEPQPGIIKDITPFLNDPSDAIRKDVALVLGASGSTAALAPIRLALADQEQYVRSYALIGLKRAQESDRLDTQLAQDLVTNLKELVAAGHNVGAAASMLLDFDPVQGKAYLLSLDILRLDSASLHELLAILADKNISVQRDRLLNMIQQLEALEMKYPNDYSLARALRLLGQHRNQQDRNLLQARSQHSNKTVAEGAALGLIAWAGLDGFSDRLWKKETAHGFNALTKPEKFYYAVMQLDGEINNGGISQYFFNSSGDYWQEAEAGLEAMGFKQRSAILQEAIGKFGNNKPSADRELRQEQLAKLARKDDELFAALDTRYYESTEVLDVIVNAYVLENAHAFEATTAKD